MILPRKMLLLPALALALATSGAGRAQNANSNAAPPKTIAQWVKLLSDSPLADSVDYPQRDAFARLNSGLQLEILREVLPKITNENLRRDLIMLAAARGGGSGADAAPPADRHLLEILDLGVNDAAPSPQQQALLLAGDLALQNFADKAAYLDWRRQTGDKSFEAIAADSAKEFAARFQSADAEEKLERFDLLLRVKYVTSRSDKTAQGVTTHTFAANGVEKIRREALQQAGLLDAMAKLLHDAKTQDLALDALSFFGAFQPDDATLQKIEPDVRALLESLIAHEETLPDSAADLLLRYRSAWVLPLLVRWTRRDYLTPGLDALTNALTNSSDARTIPLLIGLAETVSKSGASGLLTALASLTGIPSEDAHDAAWWRQWWQKNRSAYPAEVRDLTLPGLKTGLAALEERISNHTEQYGMEYRTRNQFTELEPEAKYSVMREMWKRDLPDAVKASMLMTLAEWRNGVNSLEANSRLLDEIHLGLMDDAPQTQAQAATLLFGLTMRSFSDTDAYLAWRKRNAGKPLAELAREGAEAFAARFKQANEAQKIELLQKAQQAQFLDDFSVERVGGKPVEVVWATGLTDIRRKAVMAAGLPDAVAALAHSDNPAALSEAASFLAAFHPGASYLAGLESDVRRMYAKILAKPDAESAVPLDFLLMYHGAWAGETLSALVQQMYLRTSAFNSARSLMVSSDPRVVPLLISLIDSVVLNDRQQILRQLSQITKVPFDAAHDSAWWRRWWQANRENQPEEARAIPLLELKKGPEIVAARLTQPNPQGDWEAIQFFDALDGEAQYAVLRDNWKKIGSEQTRVNLLEHTCNDNGAGQDNNAPVAPQDRPHLLDIIALGAADAAEQVRGDALGFASNLAARKIKDAADFAAWRKTVGDKPLGDVVRANTLDLIERMKRADAKTVSGLLDEATGMQWYSSLRAGDGAAPASWQVNAFGFAAIRRKAAFEAGLPEIIKERIKPTNAPEVAQAALNLAVQFLPGREFMRAIEPDVRRIVLAKKPTQGEYDFFLSSILDSYNSAWTTDVLLATARAQYATNQAEMLALLNNSRDARVIPSLISALADVDEQSWQRQPINLALARLTHTAGGANHSADWWRDWWKRNRAALPEAAQAETFPNFRSEKTASEFSVRRTRKRVSIGGDPKRAYWFITSGLLLKRKSGAKTVSAPAAPPADFSDIPTAARPGLLVVLAGGDAAGAAARYWQDLVGKNFGGRYLAAVAVSPQFRENQNPRWLTKTERGGIKTAPFTTETLAAQIVKDVEANYPVNPARVFLVGVGAGGQAAYACSLQAKTPFAGFALVGSPFRLSALPPLSAAKGRRYDLLHSPDDKAYPLFLAQVALATLQKAGANVKLTIYPLDPDAAQNAPRDAIAAGIKRLETKERK